MKILFTSYHKYPGKLHGVAAHAVHDYLAKGLGELGHEVFYKLKEKPKTLLPKGVKYTARLIKEADILHLNDGPLDYYPQIGLPWVRIIHSDIRIGGKTLELATDNWIYVSNTLAKLYGSSRYVYNGIDPAEFIYSETKDDYFFFIVGGVKRAYNKGLDIALSLARKTGIKLLIAGSSNHANELKAFKKQCLDNNAEYVGPVYGKRKAELFAGAKAVLFPSRFNEACPLIIAEALMSGTPVIASNNGAIPELMENHVGFACANEGEYLHAIENIRNIAPQDCRNLAMKRFHYLDMAKGYLAEYKKEIEFTYA